MKGNGTMKQTAIHPGTGANDQQKEQFIADLSHAIRFNLDDCRKAYAGLFQGTKYPVELIYIDEEQLTD